MSLFPRRAVRRRMRAIRGLEMLESRRLLAASLVMDIDALGTSSSPGNFDKIVNTLYFSATDVDHGTELWKSDGTEAGTVLVKDVNPDIHSSNPSQLTRAGGRMYFTADDDILVAGKTSFDADEAVLAEWNSSRTYAQRTANLTDGSGSTTRLNGGYFLVAGSTVLDDLAIDSLVATSGSDWLFYDATRYRTKVR